jgi:hypothetical protein
MFNGKILKKNISRQLFLLIRDQKKSRISAKGGKQKLLIQKKIPAAGGDEINTIFAVMQPSFLFFFLFGLLQIQVQYQNFPRMILRNALQKNHAWVRAL